MNTIWVYFLTTRQFILSSQPIGPSICCIIILLWLLTFFFWNSSHNSNTWSPNGQLGFFFREKKHLLRKKPQKWWSQSNQTTKNFVWKEWKRTRNEWKLSIFKSSLKISIPLPSKILRFWSFLSSLLHIPYNDWLNNYCVKQLTDEEEIDSSNTREADGDCS